jgi:hypothetical protein|tara:strand:+ start:1227 stop:1928 length:702 start_codon:yes stop_codon:yes gene_type:complete
MSDQFGLDDGQYQPGRPETGPSKHDIETFRPPPRQPAGERVQPIFRWEARQNGPKTTEEGRPIYDNVAFIKIVIPGDNTTEIDRKATEDDKMRFADAWAAFVAGNERPVDGTPLKEWPLLNISQTKELEHFNILTVEMLAGLSDGQIQQTGFMGLAALRDKAKGHIEVAADDGVVYENMHKLEQALDRVEELEAKVAGLEAALKQARTEAALGGTDPAPAPEPPPKPRGRKKG